MKTRVARTATVSMLRREALEGGSMRKATVGNVLLRIGIAANTGARCPLPHRDRKPARVAVCDQPDLRAVTLNRESYGGLANAETQLAPHAKLYCDRGASGPRIQDCAYNDIADLDTGRASYRAGDFRPVMTQRGIARGR